MFVTVGTDRGFNPPPFYRYIYGGYRFGRDLTTWWIALTQNKILIDNFINFYQLMRDFKEYNFSCHFNHICLAIWWEKKWNTMTIILLFKSKQKPRHARAYVTGWYLNPLPTFNKNNKVFLFKITNIDLQKTSFHAD